MHTTGRMVPILRKGFIDSSRYAPSRLKQKLIIALVQGFFDHINVNRARDFSRSSVAQRRKQREPSFLLQLSFKAWGFLRPNSFENMPRALASLWGDIRDSPCDRLAVFAPEMLTEITQHFPTTKISFKMKNIGYKPVHHISGIPVCSLPTPIFPWSNN